MKRWEAKRVEEVRAAAEALLQAANYAEEYISRVRFVQAMRDLAAEAEKRRRYERQALKSESVA